MLLLCRALLGLTACVATLLHAGASRATSLDFFGPVCGFTPGVCQEGGTSPRNITDPSGSFAVQFPAFDQTLGTLDSVRARLGGTVAASIYVPFDPNGFSFELDVQLATSDGTVVWDSGRGVGESACRPAEDGRFLCAEANSYLDTRVFTGDQLDRFFEPLTLTYEFKFSSAYAPFEIAATRVNAFAIRDVEYRFTPTPTVPEPRAVLLFAVALVVFVRFVRRPPAIAALAAATLAFLAAGASRASEIAFREDCSYTGCNYILKTDPNPFSTTLDKPIVEWTVDLPHPADVENWTPTHFLAQGFGSFTLAVVYPNVAPFGGADAIGISFFDADGSLFGFLPGRPLQDGCRLEDRGSNAGKWVCTEGDSGPSNSFEYGELNETGHANPVLPPLDRPITIRMEWSISGADPNPESSRFSFHNYFVGYGYRRISPAVPEPTAALLYAGGIAVFAAARRRAR